MLPLLLLACAAPTPARVVLVGIDGADWDVLDPYIQQGHLPALAWMRQQGATAPLREASGMSPESWTTLATGHSPQVHGIVEGAGGVVGTFAARPDQLRVRRLWDMAGSRGRRSLVVDWWVTAPPYPVEGVLLSRESREAWPPGAERETLEPIQPTDHREEMKRLGLAAPRTGPMRAWLKKGGFDLYLLPIYVLDVALHGLYAEWAAARAPLPSDPDLAARIQLGDALVLEAARMADTLVGMAYHAAGEDGFVVLVSDHGFAPAPTPTRRLALSRSVLDGGPGTVESGAVPVPGGQVRLESREEPGEGELAFTLVYPEISGDAPALERLEGLEQDGRPLFRRMGSVLVPGAWVVEEAGTAVGRLDAGAWRVFVQSGTHRKEDDGVFGVWGPGVRAGALDVPVHAVDVTPTVLFLMGLPVARDLEGSPITSVLTEARPLRHVSTYEDGTRPWVVPGQVQAPDVEQLKALGYISP